MVRSAASPASRPRRKRADRYHHGDLRRALLQAAVRTIQTHGVERLTLRAVGDTLGVSRTALYRHFADKSALLAAVAGEGFRMLRVELLEAWHEASEGREGFDAMGIAYVRFATTHPSHYRVMFGGFVDRDAGDQELATEGAAAFQVLVDAIVAQQHDGLVRPDDPTELALFVWATVHGIAMLTIDGRIQHSRFGVEELIRYANDRMRLGFARVSGPAAG
jgi:AcrR family transcriptional regulator